MKNLDLRGSFSVFRYTVQQHYKTKSVLIFLVILFVIAVGMFPLAVFVSGGKNISQTSVKTLYLRNETSLALDAADITSDEVYSGVTVKETEDDAEALAKKVAGDKTAAYAVIKMEQKKMCFEILTGYGKEGSVSKKDAGTLNTVLEGALHKALLRTLSVDEAQEALIHSQTHSQVSKISDYLRGAEETGADTHVFSSMFYCYFIMMLNALAMGYIFQQCMEEKVSKLVEALLISVSPTALMFGKLLAVTVFIFGGLALIIGGLILSYRIALTMTDASVLKGLIQKITSFDIESLHITGTTIVLFVVCLLLAYAIVASFSAIAGSCCSKTEDTQQASMVTVLFLMVGYMIGAIVPMFENDAAYLFVSLFPLTSIFSALPNYVCGKIGAGVFTVALIIQVLTAFLLVKTAGNVYRMMIFYRGAFPKPKQIIQMLHEQKKAERSAVRAAAGKEGSHGE